MQPKVKLSPNRSDRIRQEWPLKFKSWVRASVSGTHAGRGRADGPAREPGRVQSRQRDAGHAARRRPWRGCADARREGAAIDDRRRDSYKAVLHSRNQLVIHYNLLLFLG